MREPWFWRDDSFTARGVRTALKPAGWLYRHGQTLRQFFTTPHRANAAIICIGNATLGGTGKTPMALEIQRLLAPIAGPISFLSRGYGGTEVGPTQVTQDHTATDVGDEPLLLAQAAPTYVAQRRAEGAKLAEAEGAAVIIMDDGYQNPTVAKDVSLLLVDDRDNDASGNIFPAGPYRERLIDAAARADAICLIGAGKLDPAIGNGVPRFRASITATSPTPADGRYVAFCGIGRPEKFFHSLESTGAEIAARMAFPDHHAYREPELDQLKQLATDHDATLITTEKDLMRLPAEFRKDVKALPIHMVFEDTAGLVDIITARLDASGKDWRAT